MQKLTKKNEEVFFVGMIGTMFTASKRYQYAEIQEIAAAQGYAMRKVTPEDLAKATREVRNACMHIWQTDAPRLFICISKDEREAAIAEHEAKWKQHQKEQAIKDALDWFDLITNRLEGYKRDVEKHKEWFSDSLTNKDRYIKPIGCIHSTMLDIKNMMNNMPFPDAVHIVQRLVEAGVHEGLSKDE